MSNSVLLAMSSVSYALRQKYPTAHITWVVEPTAYEIVKHNPCVDEVILFQKKSFKTFKGFRENFKPFYKLLHQRKYDISIDLQGLFKSMAVVLTANAKKKIGYVDMREGSNLI
ncbi:glycosyltransferase family 9 protein, partial [Megamonas hypermegale]|uniref:glycosyltransferase family 9 protein n=1 Tax=Megamonas hypermegale TaxID=158847 RepID=UPI00255C5561